MNRLKRDKLTRAELLVGRAQTECEAHREESSAIEMVCSLLSEAQEQLSSAKYP